MVPMRVAAMLLALFAVSPVWAQSTEELLTTIKAVDREGKGNAEAARALAELTSRDASVLPEVLVGFEGANPLAENWLRAAVETVADRAIRRGEKIPTEKLRAFVDDRDQHARARRLAYEWLIKVEPKATDEIIPNMLLDPSAEMRRDAVARLIDAAEGQEGDAAVGTYRTALRGAVHEDQVKQIVKALEESGVEVDLPKHFGFLSEWWMIGPFDNRDGIGYQAVYPPEKEIDLDAEYTAKYPGAKGTNVWQKVVTEDDYGVLDIAEQIENHKGSVFYATTTFDAAEPRSVQLRLGTPNAWKMWVNGELVFSREEYHRGTKLDQYRVAVDLKKGENRILLKVCQNEQDQDWAQKYQFQVRVTDGAGSAVLPSGETVSLLEEEVRAIVHCCPVREEETLSSYVSTLVQARAGDDWLQFRGNNTDGVATGALPTELSEESIAWKIDLPGRGVSSPIVIGDHVVVTASSGPDHDRLHVLCVSASSGETLWERQFWATGRTQTHNSISPATPSPASDGKRIFAFYSSNDMACLDLEGNLLWFRGIGHDFPNASNSLGMSSSPVVVDGTLVTMVESDAEAFTVGIDVATGEPKWRIDRPRKANWSSPAVLRTDAGSLALVGGTGALLAIKPDTGEIAWRWGSGSSTVSSSTAAEGLVFVPAGGLTALDPTNIASAEREGVTISEPAEVWKDGKLAPSTGSPAVVDGRVHVVNGGGVLTVADARTGEVAFRTRLEGKGGASATPIVAAGHLYLVDKSGLLQVVRLGEDEGEVVGKLNLDASIQCTPAAAGGSLFIRSDEHLWCIGD